MAFVVCLLLGPIPRRHVGLGLTPNLWTLAEGAPSVGRAVLPSSSTANLATFMTGVPPDQHGLWGDRVVVDGVVRQASEIGLARPTVLSLCRADGVSSIALGATDTDVCVGGFGEASLHWPTDPMSEAPMRDDVMVARIADGIRHLHDAGSGLLVATVKGASALMREQGPDSPEAGWSFAELDTQVGSIVRALRPRWAETVLVALSDHDQLTVTNHAEFDAEAMEGELLHRSGTSARVVVHGDAAVVHWAEPPAASGPTLRSIYRRHPAIDAWVRLSPTEHLLSAAPGAIFAGPGFARQRAASGGPHTRGQLAVVSGGHPAVRALRANTRRGPVPMTRWAPTIAALLGLHQSRRAASLIP